MPRHVLQVARLPGESGVLRAPVGWPTPDLLEELRAIRPELLLRS